MRFIRFETWVLLFIVMVTKATAEDVIILNSGISVRGRIVSKEKDVVRINVEGVDFSCFTSDIKTISIGTSQSQTPVSENNPSSYKTYHVVKTFRIEVLADFIELQLRVPLPRSDIAGQMIRDLTTSPPRNALFRDQDDNEIAVFHFRAQPPGSIINVSISYDVDICKQNAGFRETCQADGAAVENLTAYLQSEETFRIDDSQIRSIVETIIQPEMTSFDKAQAIYRYMTANFTYENMTDNAGMFNPREILLKKKGNCMDLSRLFVAVARSAGIPSRQVSGIAFNPAQPGSSIVLDAGHMWAEVFLSSQGWVPVDATFGLSARRSYCCFSYDHHIRESYGQMNSRQMGSLYRGFSIEGLASGAVSGASVKCQMKITVNKKSERR